MRLLALLLCWLPVPSLAFVYLEHAWFTDRACQAAQDRLAGHGELGTDVALTARYLALAVTCPQGPVLAYCVGDQKQATSLLHRLGAPPDSADTPPMTAGDFSALVDHLSRFGPVAHLPRADQPGLLTEVIRWLSLEEGGVGGVIEDVAEEQCTAAAQVPWPEVEADVASALVAGQLVSLPDPLRLPLARVDAPQGPTDPDGWFTFDNPHYLDMVERNASHFAPAAHGHWAGLHAAADALAERGCAAVLSDPHRGLAGCAQLSAQISARLAIWGRTAPDHQLAPVRAALSALSAGQAPVLAAELPGALLGLVLEAVGQHYLQDELAGGHIRVDRGTLSLQESRYDHDRDGAHGVQAWLVTGDRGHPFVAFGDGRLLGPRASAGPLRCDLDASPEATTDCLIRHQRGLVTLVSAASFVDWALGAPLQRRAPTPCAQRPPLEAFACGLLPVAPVRADGAAPEPPPAPRWARGDLPNPPPDFDYESLGTAIGVDPTGGHNRLALRLKLYTPMGAVAHWARSHQIEVASRAERWELAYGHLFHFRWAARFLVDAGAFTWLGAGDGFRAGLAPHGGITFLPEGWIKAPLSFGAGYHPLIRLFGGDGVAVEGHYVELWLGLAFL